MLTDLDAVRPEWHSEARCSGRSELMFGPIGEQPVARRTRENRAKALCDICPVSDPCREYALANRIHDGVWGGLGVAQRPGSRLRRNRRDRAALPTSSGSWADPR